MRAIFLIVLVFGSLTSFGQIAIGDTLKIDRTSYDMPVIEVRSPHDFQQYRWAAENEAQHGLGEDLQDTLTLKGKPAIFFCSNEYTGIAIQKRKHLWQIAQLESISAGLSLPTMEIETLALNGSQYVLVKYRIGEGRWYWQNYDSGFFIIDLNQAKVILEVITYSTYSYSDGYGDKWDPQITHREQQEYTQEVTIQNGQLVIPPGTCMDEEWHEGDEAVTKRPCTDRYPTGIFNWTGSHWVKVAEYTP